MKTKKAKIRSFLQNFRALFRNPFTYCYLAIVVIIIVATFVVYETETKTESGIETMFDSVWFTLVAVFAAYFDYCVKSVPGRIAAILLLLLGMLVFSAITGKLASVFMEMEMKKDKGLLKLKNISGHFLICGWRANFEKILDTVMISNPDIDPEMVVLVNGAPSECIEQIRTLPRFKGMHYISGDFADETTLKKARIQNAERVLIISDQSQNYSQLEKDSRTVLAVLTMKNMNPFLYIAAELTDSKFEKHLHMAHCDEIILSSDYEYSLLASASSGLGYCNVIKELIGDDAETGIFIEDIPSHFVGKTYGEFQKTVSKNSVLVGLLLNTGNFYQRRKDALREAQKNPDVKKIINNLQKVKYLKSNEPLLAPPGDYVIQPYAKAIFVKGRTFAES